ncbi:MAG: hypothetical protein ACI8P0_005144 [Planctomycetaceae bacterium]|jgi:hypothetical protein
MSNNVTADTGGSMSSTSTQRITATSGEHSEGRSRQRWRCLQVVCVCWVILCVCGVASLVHYSNTAGADSAGIPAEVPSQAIDNNADYTLLMFVHPHCSCSRASVRQLERILARCDGRVATRIYFYSPDDQPETWVRSALWDQARGIPGVKTQLDRNGSLARQCGVTTSGHVQLFDIRKQLQFSGGITVSRGHEGDNFGSSSVMAIIRGESDDQTTTETPVFGCQIQQVLRRGQS